MENEIKEIIEKNLPAHVGEVLRKRLEKADRDASDLEAQRNVNKANIEMIRGLEKEILEYKKLDERNAALEKREKEVEDRESKQDVWEAKLKVSEMEKRLADNTNFVGMVFKSPIFRKTVSEYEGGQQIWNNHLGRSEFVTNGNKSKNETIEKD